MGTLTDITSRAVNKNLRNAGSPSHTPKNTPSHSEKNAKTSNFMTPTMASSTRANITPRSAGHTRTSTPTSLNVEKAATGKWMSSAAKRVGFRRVGGDGTLRTKKEGSKQSYNAVTFPDKVCSNFSFLDLAGPMLIASPIQLSASSKTHTPDSPRLNKLPTSSLANKPLPSPPIAQVTTAYTEEPRSLIDASEKPLQRTSPKSPQTKEEWPVLFPQKPTSPEVIRKMLRQSPPKPARVVSRDQERYPLLGGSQVATSNVQQKPMSRAPSSYCIQRKQVSASSLHDDSASNRPTEVHKDDAVKPAMKEASPACEASLEESKATQRLSAAAAAVEKSSTDIKSIKEPRQTRTSSLRARISAGQVIRDSPNKVLGFTDFTAEKAPLAKPSREDLGSNAGFRARSSSSFSKAVTKKPSTESLGGHRAPAQFVAGSRRPATTRRPSSRNSLRGDSRAPSPSFLEPSRQAPPVPTAKVVISARKSSIPLPRNFISNAVANDVPLRPSANGATVQYPKSDKKVTVDLGALGDNPNASVEEHAFSPSGTGHVDENSHLESIAESPRSTYRSKRLSTKSSNFGPKLTISNSAERFILGEKEPGKESPPLVKKKKSMDYLRATIKNEHKNDTRGKTSNHGHKGTPIRPLSSQGFPETGPRDVASARAARTKKVNSVDLGIVSSTAGAKIDPMPAEDVDEDKLKEDKPPAVEDPFLEIKDRPDFGVEAVEELERSLTPNGALDAFHTGSVVSLAKDSATPTSDAMPVVSASLPETLQEHINKSSDEPKDTRMDEVKARKGANSFPDGTEPLPPGFNQIIPSTPQQENRVEGSPSSSGFPPRSSSRMQHPDYTTTVSAKSSSISSVEQPAAQLQQEISAAHSVGAKVADGKVSQQPSDVSIRTSHISSQTILADVASKRDSTAHESTKSQASVSKGLISNFRGLFHKRTSDNLQSPNVRSTKKSGKRATVTAHGSPHPSMSNIHPIYRPTQASMNRNGATAQRANTHGVALTSPGTPAVISPMPTEVSATTAMAMEILESARKESSSPKKERLLELGKLMVDTITQARDAEKAMEEARQAARKAEVAHALCKKSVSDVANLVKDWRNEVTRF
ncbi:MAG: hypothetical protein Q9207_006968 [Kuettlingeria erythrocarpa]